MLLEYISQSYMTLMLLTGLAVILTANRHTEIEGLQYIRSIMGMVFLLTLCEYTDYWCSVYPDAVKLLYVKSAIAYNIYPLMLLLELFLIAPIRHKRLLLLPYAVNMLCVTADLFGTEIVYSFTAEGGFLSGRLHILPALVDCFYMIMLMICSIRFAGRGERSKALVVLFITLSTVITVFLEYTNIITGYTDEVCALEMLLYYCYLGAIQHSTVQKKLHESELSLEQQKNELLMAQIQPHFINNSLMAIQARCICYPEIYESMKNFSRYLRSNFDNIGNSQAITFAQELKNIKAYLALEKMNFGDRLSVEYDIENDDFLLPALTVEPLVENAVRHGIAARERGGVVQIIQRDEEDGIIIEVHDIGRGAMFLTEKQEKRRGIGIQNVRARLAVGGGGELKLIPRENGTCARIQLKNVRYAADERKDVT